MTVSNNNDITFPPGTFREGNVNYLFKSVTNTCMKEMSGQRIYNHNSIDAWYLFKKILTYAKKKGKPVTLFTGRMRADFYNSLTDELKNLIAKKVPVRAYLTEIKQEYRQQFLHGGKSDEGQFQPNKFAQLLDDAIAKCSDSYQLTFLNPDIYMGIPHVIYAGDRGEVFRLEKDPETHEAVAAFGPMTSPVGKRVAEAFDRYIQQISENAKK